MPDEPAARRSRAQLTPQECVTLYRTKYTAPLVCIECGRLIASLAGYVEERIKLPPGVGAYRERAAHVGMRDRVVVQIEADVGGLVYRDREAVLAGKGLDRQREQPRSRWSTYSRK